MKKDSAILILLFVVSVILGVVGGMFWRAEQVIRLKTIFSQTEVYLNNIVGFDDNAVQLWRQLGYAIVKKDTINLKQ